MVRGDERGCAVFTGHHAAAIGRQHHSLRISRINHDIVDNDLRIAYPLPGLARVRGLPQAFGRSGVNSVWIAGILLQNARPARREWNSLDLLELIACAGALVNTGAGAGEYV